MDEDAWFAADCVGCDQPVGDRGEHINHAYIAKRAEWDWPAVGNVAHDIPAVYAVTLYCDTCIESNEDIDPEYAVKSDDGDIERVPVDELEDLPPMGEVIEGEAALDLDGDDNRDHD